MTRPEILPYGVALREVLSRGNSTEMQQMLAVSNVLLASSRHVEKEDLATWVEAHSELQSALDESRPLAIRGSDVIANSNGIVVIDNADLAKRLGQLQNSDLESDAIYFITLKIEF